MSICILNEITFKSRHLIFPNNGEDFPLQQYQIKSVEKSSPNFLCFLMLDVYGIQRNPIILYLRTGLDEEQKAESHQMPLREYSHEKQMLIVNFIHRTLFH